MTETEFNDMTEAVLARIAEELDAADAGCECELKAVGVLEVEFDDGSRMVINRHAAAQEIWVAARAGGHHFRYQDGAWRDTRDSAELYAALSRMLSRQTGCEVVIRGPG
ncbi:MAG: iron donor protein CyaY [Betaproteobacteria bacterium]|nr:iron donor protein CyaY [Betaproteobacteria bacterium]